MVIKVFDEKNPCWDKYPKFVNEFLRINLVSWNDQLNLRGYIFLKDIYETLGFKTDGYSITHGWHRSKNSFVELGIEPREDGSYLLKFIGESDITNYFD